MLDERANSLLTDEETNMFFYQNCLVFPSGIKYAISYLIKLLTPLIRAKENQKY